MAISTSDSKRSDAEKLGATDFVVLDNEGGFDSAYNHSVDVLLVCGSGKSTNWKKLGELVKTRGTIHFLDVPEAPISLPIEILVYQNRTITGTYVGSNQDIKEMLDFASKTGVRSWIQTVDSSLEGVNQGIQDLINRKAHYRIVIKGEGRSA